MHGLLPPGAVYLPEIELGPNLRRRLARCKTTGRRGARRVAAVAPAITLRWPRHVEEFAAKLDAFARGVG